MPGIGIGIGIEGSLGIGDTEQVITDAILTEDGLFYITTEDGVYYMQLEV